MIAYLKESDDLCKSKLIGALSKFCNHSEPLVPLADIQRFIDRAPEVFGGLWTFLSDIRGVPKKKKRDSATDEKTNSIFSLILTIARVASRRSLTHWALIQNISSFACGVGQTAKSAFAFFGSHLSSSSREVKIKRLFATDGEKESAGTTIRKTHSAHVPYLPGRCVRLRQLPTRSNTAVSTWEALERIFQGYA